MHALFTMRLAEIHEHGQAIWLDDFHRELLDTGELARLVREDDIRGVTTNPTIFDKAIAGSTAYDAELRQSRQDRPSEIYEHIVVEDLQRAADILQPTFAATGGLDGLVSVEVSPHLARDTSATIAEARRLWNRIARPNLMVKVPGTEEGAPAIEQLTAEGININVTLLFSREACRRVRDAFMVGLEARVARALPIDRIASVASLFVSRIDVLVSKIIERRLSSADADERLRLERLAGKAGIANARLAYADWKDSVRSARWQALSARGARPQRMLWASTGTKDKSLPDVWYVEALIGPETVDTVPPATLAAMRDHGRADEHLEDDLEGARAVMDDLSSAGISIDAVCQQLVDEGVAQFSKSYDALMALIDRKRSALAAEPQDAHVPMS